ncbi:hypothetical protein EIP86_009976 [Pleurotus ostreatoroseus]|nr:hypothetical protein EIP86_009976 [Pleurotus ostreatoroseus]
MRFTVSATASPPPGPVAPTTPFDAFQAIGARAPQQAEQPLVLLPTLPAGLTTFDRALGANLLYRFECPQYAEVRRRYITGPAVVVDQWREMSTIYCAEHLLRKLGASDEPPHFRVHSRISVGSTIGGHGLRSSLASLGDVPPLPGSRPGTASRASSAVCDSFMSPSVMSRRMTFALGGDSNAASRLSVAGPELKRMRSSMLVGPIEKLWVGERDVYEWLGWGITYLVAFLGIAGSAVRYSQDSYARTCPRLPRLLATYTWAAAGLLDIVIVYYGMHLTVTSRHLYIPTGARSEAHIVLYPSMYVYLLVFCLALIDQSFRLNKTHTWNQSNLHQHIHKKFMRFTPLGHARRRMTEEEVVLPVLSAVVYPYWRQRRMERGGHPIIPVVNDLVDVRALMPIYFLDAHNVRQSPYQPLLAAYASRCFKFHAASQPLPTLSSDDEDERPTFRACRTRFGLGGRMHVDRGIPALPSEWLDNLTGMSDHRSLFPNNNSDLASSGGLSTMPPVLAPTINTPGTPSQPEDNEKIPTAIVIKNIPFNVKRDHHAAVHALAFVLRDFGVLEPVAVLAARCSCASVSTLRPRLPSTSLSPLHKPICPSPSPPSQCSPTTSPSALPSQQRQLPHSREDALRTRRAQAAAVRSTMPERQVPPAASYTSRTKRTFSLARRSTSRTREGPLAQALDAARETAAAAAAAVRGLRYSHRAAVHALTLNLRILSVVESVVVLANPVLALPSPGSYTLSIWPIPGSTPSGTKTPSTELDLHDPSTLEIYWHIRLFEDDPMQEDLVFSRSLSPKERRVVHVVADAYAVSAYPLPLRGAPILARRTTASPRPPLPSRACTTLLPLGSIISVGSVGTLADSPALTADAGSLHVTIHAHSGVSVGSSIRGRGVGSSLASTGDVPSLPGSCTGTASRGSSAVRDSFLSLPVICRRTTFGLGLKDDSNVASRLSVAGPKRSCGAGRAEGGELVNGDFEMTTASNNTFVEDGKLYIVPRSSVVQGHHDARRTEHAPSRAHLTHALILPLPSGQGPVLAGYGARTFSPALDDGEQDVMVFASTHDPSGSTKHIPRTSPTYVRRRESKAIRKIRAQQATYSDKMIRLQGELGVVMDLANCVLQCEAT